MFCNRRLASAAVLIMGLSGWQAVLGVEPSKVERGEPEVKQLLKLMDTDQSGKVSREEFMRFMAAEFDRLDVNKDGELDVRELTQLRVRPRPDNR
jgi:EF hand